MLQVTEEAIADFAAAGNRNERLRGQLGMEFTASEYRAALHARTAKVAAGAAVSAVKHLPPELLLTAAAPPQRLLEAVGKLLWLLVQDVQRQQQGQQQGRQGRGGSGNSKSCVDAVLSTMAQIGDAVMLLSTDERLLEGCVPGWLWAEGTVPAPGQEPVDLKSAVCLWKLAELYDARGGGGTGGGGGGAVPSGEPVVTMVLTSAGGGGGRVPAAATSAATTARFETGRWAAEQVQRRGELAVLARRLATKAGSLEGSVWRQLQGARSGAAGEGEAGSAGAADGGGGRETEGGGGVGFEVMWPPRLLRLCASPLCSNFSGGAEADLKLQYCSRCCAVRYCGAACQRQHWPQHKEQCGRWAGRWQADSK